MNRTIVISSVAVGAFAAMLYVESQSSAGKSGIASSGASGQTDDCGDGI